MNTRQLDYLIEETLAAICELEDIAADSEAIVHMNCVLDMLRYQRARLDVQLYGADIPVDLK